MNAERPATLTSVRNLRERRILGAREAILRRRIRELVDELLRGVIGATLAGSPAEIAEVLAGASSSVAPFATAPSRRMAPSLERGAGDRPIDRAFTPAPTRSAPKAGRPRGRVPLQRADLDEDRRQAQNDPFDITSPSDLLASTDPRPSLLEAVVGPAPDAAPPVLVETAATEDQVAFPAAPTLVPRPAPAGDPADTARAAAPNAAVPAGAGDTDREAESERRPRIVLREGERLLSATGSGMVIRRARVR